MDNELFFPAYLKKRKIWLVWKLEPDKRNPGRKTKIPYTCSLRRASSTNPDTWGTFERCRDVWEWNPHTVAGVGIAVTLADELVFIDIDHCRDDAGTLSDTAQLILSAFPDCFAEWSQSGEGIHVLARGRIPRSFKNSAAGVEMYSSGRFIAMTGNAFQRMEPAEAQQGLDLVYDRFKPPERKPVQRQQPAATSDLLPHEILSRIRSRKFVDVFNGSWQKDFSSQSEADLYVCGTLAFWSECDPAVMDDCFRRSGLMREKWDERRGALTYGQRTISAAISGCLETRTEYRRRAKAEERRAVWDAWGDI